MCLQKYNSEYSSVQFSANSVYSRGLLPASFFVRLSAPRRQRERERDVAALLQLCCSSVAAPRRQREGERDVSAYLSTYNMHALKKAAE